MTASSTPSDLPAVFDALGITVAWVDQQRGEVYAKCPMHRRRTGKEDGHPSWSMNVKSGQHNCFSCGYGGNVVGLVMDMKFRNDVFAARRWLRQFGVDLEAAADIPAWEEWEEVKEGRRITVPFGEAWLELHDEAPDKALEERHLTREAVDEYGCLWDFQKMCWILPIYMPDGTFLGWQEKAKGYFRNHPVGMPKSQTLFGLKAFTRGEVVLLESPLDCVRLRSEGYEGGLSSMGVHVSDDQMRIILDLTDTLVLALDNDKDGIALTKQLVKAYRRRIRLFVLNYDHCPDRKDIGEMTRDEMLEALATARFATEVKV